MVLTTYEQITKLEKIISNGLNNESLTRKTGEKMEELMIEFNKENIVYQKAIDEVNFKLLNINVHNDLINYDITSIQCINCASKSLSKYVVKTDCNHNICHKCLITQANFYIKNKINYFQCAECNSSVKLINITNFNT